MLQYNSKFPFLRSTNGSAGYDIRSPIECIVKAKSRMVIKTDLNVDIPKEYVGLIRSRSGLAFKHGIEVFHGTIDSDYYGKVSILMKNESNKDYKIKMDSKIAQMIIVPHYILHAVKISEEDFSMFDNEEKKKVKGRGDKGFGSTDI
jgi:dUTP pyrophosphatase